MTSLRVLILTLLVAACDQSPTVASLPVCQPIAQLAPASASIHVGQIVHIAVARDGSCPAATVRNETPAVIQLDSVSSGLVRVTGLAVGTGRMRVLAAGDTLFTALATIVVTP
jgi:hypothetical protein